MFTRIEDYMLSKGLKEDSIKAETEKLQSMIADNVCLHQTRINKMLKNEEIEL